ncbi:dihydrofolate reductase family protein [Trujillonella endophytica]|uniref:Pyrimidine reductase, riboflavin biosynthesis n=1 Tax=Trujillonella endophytica TaxID=673521 RepID=A0A1H8PHX7_9ACTN|nr:dihydrofolate reductase family protein [Trujillella endophytica]SEO41426.1 Pyrimidine reductase, riboflavin biosynthesis [Trujillella endophytica]
MRRLLPVPDPGSDTASDLASDAALADAYRLPAGRAMRVNFVGSLDGAIAIEGRSGGLGSPGDKRVFRTLRALADVVLVGAGTATAEGYRPVAADSAVGALRTALGRPATAPIAVVSRQVSLAPGDRLAVDSTFLVTCAASDAGRRAALADVGVTVLVCGEDEVDLPLALDRLAERGLEQVLCEGGPALFAAALAAGCVDELDLTIAPALVGGESRLLPWALAEPARPRLTQLLESDGVLFTRYALGG